MSKPLPPTLDEISMAHADLKSLVRQTPILPWQGPEKDRRLGPETEVMIKLELFQLGGSFKVRGALRVMRALSHEALSQGVTAVSAGNHAIAVAYAARLLGSHAKVVMPHTANPFRVRRCQELGAEVVLVDNVKVAFDTVEQIQEEEGRTFVHPFEGPGTTLGTATVGWEFAQQAGPFDAAILPIGGGGLASGMASALRQLYPGIKLYGVEPEGADSMTRSFASGKPEAIEAVRTIADSLGSPFALPYSFGLCQQLLDGVVRVTDTQLVEAMRLSFSELKLAVEPAGAASLAALLGPLAAPLRGQRVGLIACGANIDPETFFRYLSQFPSQ
ncbi:MAG: threonine/serine dehydratase [Bacteroidetes bacterium]|nr:MAG: threonine/serine dehydratase [Bacteroidota bacterium]